MLILALGEQTLIKLYRIKSLKLTTYLRATAAKDAVGDKMDQHGHDAKAEAHKQYSKA
jgi:hypothetical protein